MPIICGARAPKSRRLIPAARAARVHRPRVDSTHGDRVEVAAADVATRPLQSFGEDCSQPMHAPRDTRQSFGTVIHGVHACHHGQQYLSSADVRRGFFASNVLLPRLQRQAICRAALRIDRDSHQSPGHRSLERILARQKRGVRSAESERHSKALRIADDDVGAPGARRLEQCQREQIGRHAKQCAGFVRLRDQRRMS